MNGTYSFLTSSTSTSVIGGNLFLTFYGDSIPDVFLSPANYSSTGAYVGSVTTLVSGSPISGEWIQIGLPYTLYITTYSINSNVNGGPSWNYLFPKSFYLCGSNDGTNWSTVDNRSGVTCNTNSLNSFTAPTQTQGYKYFRLIGQQIGVGSSQGYRMAVCVGLRGTYRG